MTKGGVTQGSLVTATPTHKPLEGQDHSGPCNSLCGSPVPLSARPPPPTPPPVPCLRAQHC